MPIQDFTSYIIPCLAVCVVNSLLEEHLGRIFHDKENFQFEWIEEREEYSIKENCSNGEFLSRGGNKEKNLTVNCRAGIYSLEGIHDNFDHLQLVEHLTNVTACTEFCVVNSSLNEQLELIFPNKDNFQFEWMKDDNLNTIKEYCSNGEYLSRGDDKKVELTVNCLAGIYSLEGIQDDFDHLQLVEHLTNVTACTELCVNSLLEEHLGRIFHDKGNFQFEWIEEREEYSIKENCSNGDFLSRGGNKEKNLTVNCRAGIYSLEGIQDNFDHLQLAEHLTNVTACTEFCVVNSSLNEQLGRIFPGKDNFQFEWMKDDNLNTIKEYCSNGEYLSRGNDKKVDLTVNCLAGIYSLEGIQDNFDHLQLVEHLTNVTACTELCVVNSLLEEHLGRIFHDKGNFQFEWIEEREEYSIKENCSNGELLSRGGIKENNLTVNCREGIYSLEGIQDNFDHLQLAEHLTNVTACTEFCVVNSSLEEQLGRIFHDKHNFQFEWIEEREEYSIKENCSNGEFLSRGGNKENNLTVNCRAGIYSLEGIQDNFDLLQLVEHLTNVTACTECEGAD
ncbi:hypothetical protein FHG87_020455 [Trinorchestia longiramus]|nr:hypothetical protein FHG87_020455 [Trinorchestia longiramus]